MDPFLASLRLPYELAYMGPYGTQYRPVEVEAPDRSLPVARITQVIKMIYYCDDPVSSYLLSLVQVPEGYIQDITDYLSAVTFMYSLHVTSNSREDEPRRRARR